MLVLHWQQINVPFFGTVKLVVTVAMPLQLRAMERLMTQGTLIRYDLGSRKKGGNSLREASGRYNISSKHSALPSPNGAQQKARALMGGLFISLTLITQQ